MAIDRHATALAILRVSIGVFFVFEAIGKLQWFTDASLLSRQLDGWLRGVPAGSWSQLFLQRVAIPGAGDVCAARAARRALVRRRARHGILDAALRLPRVSHGAHVSVRQRRAVQILDSDERVRAAGARLDAGPDHWRCAFAVECSRQREIRQDREAVVGWSRSPF